jgi:glycogen synthase
MLISQKDSYTEPKKDYSRLLCSVAGLYGTPIGDYHDNAERFTLFSRAVLEGPAVVWLRDSRSIGKSPRPSS